MTRHIHFVVGAAMLVGCGDSLGEVPQEVGGEVMKPYFPMDGDVRRGLYECDDPTIDYRIAGDLQPDTRADDLGNTLYTFIFSKDCASDQGECVEGEVLWTWEISASTSRGTFIHSLNGVDFAEPFQIATPRMTLKDTITTTIDGVGYESTYEAKETCPNKMNFSEDDQPECVRFSLSDGGSDELSMEMWVAPLYGLFSFQFEGEDLLWQLRRFDFEED